jgi:hypothetical protein
MKLARARSGVSIAKDNTAEAPNKIAVLRTRFLDTLTPVLTAT